MRHRIVTIIVLGAALSVGACATLGQIAALAKVDFSLDRVADLSLAGVSLARIRSVDDLSALDLARVATAVAGGELPLAMTVDVAADNPAENPTARLVRLDWTLVLDDRETVSGVLDQDVVLPAGEVTTIALPLELDLLRFFSDDARSLVDLALAAGGGGGRTPRLELRAKPTVTTPLGPLSYPGEITISAVGRGR